jgi:hypothetical protein
MGRLFILVIFIIFFIIFSIVKLFFDGTKAAYKAVFTPEDEEREREQRVVKNCIEKIIEFMQKNYNGNTEEIPKLLFKVDLLHANRYIFSLNTSQIKILNFYLMKILQIKIKTLRKILQIKLKTLMKI